jgi:hypothetical protein
LVRSPKRSGASGCRSAGPGPAFEDYASGTSPHADQALGQLAERLRERRGAATGGSTPTPLGPGTYDVVGMRAVPVRDPSAWIADWHLAIGDIRPKGTDEVVGYRTWCGIDCATKDVVLQPGRREGICLTCVRSMAAKDAPPSKAPVPRSVPLSAWI